MESTADSFSATLHPYEFAPVSVQAAADLTAARIAERYSKLWLSLSGGLDSEFVANVLLRNGIDFTPVHVLGLDPVETDYAMNWSRRNQRELLLIEYGYGTLAPVYTALAKRINNAAMGSVLTAHIATKAEREGAALITGMGEFFNDEDYPAPAGDRLDLYERDYFLEILMRGNIRHPGAFLSYTPELVYALLKSLDPQLPTQEIKANAYGLPFRPKTKNILLPTEDREHRHQALGSLAEVLNTQSHSGKNTPKFTLLSS